MVSRDRGAEKERKNKRVAKTNKNLMLQHCQREGLAFMPFSALGGHKVTTVKHMTREAPPLSQWQRLST